MPKLTPTNIKKLKGTLQQCRLNPFEPKPSKALGTVPPKYFAADEKACWRELHRMVPPGVLMSSDQFIAEIACLLMAQVRRREPMSASQLSQLTFCLSHLGCTPTDRAKVQAVPAADEDEDFSQFLN